MTRFFRYALMASVALAVASCSLFDYGTYTGKKYAIVYGITNYVSTTDPNLTASNSPNLSYPHLDAQSIAALLTSKGYTVTSRWVDGSNNVYVDGTSVGSLGTGAGDSAVPSKANLQVDLAAVGALVGSNDEFVFYFSGHGTQDTSSSPNVEYFDTYGSVQWYPSQTINGVTYAAGYYANVANAVADTEMGGMLTSTVKTNRRVVILDSCNSGGFIGNSLEVDGTSQNVSGTTVSVSGINILTQAIANYASYTASASGVSPYNATVLSAAGKDELSYDGTSTMAHGAMTYYLLQAATSGDLNGDGSVTVLEAFSYVKAAIETYWNSVYPADTFTPHISGGPVDFVLF